MSDERILIVDDEPTFREVLSILLARQGYQVVEAASGAEALRVLRSQRCDLVVTDYNMPGMTGTELISQIRGASLAQLRDVPIVMLTGVGRNRDAVEAIQQGANDFVKKPFNNEELLIAIRRAMGLRALMEENTKLRKELQDQHGLENLIGSSPAMQNVYDMVRRVKDARINCLLLGESGTGKEMVARAIHYSGTRASKPFVAVNCGAIPDGLIESELFGHKRGSFTGALRDKIGFFQAADGGTIFLDEVGDMPLHTQVKVLRALSMRRVTAVGDVNEVEVDVRVVAATNKDLEAEVKSGRFREDLYYRLNVVRVELPPLRDRDWDFLLLARHFVRLYAQEYGKAVRDLSPEVVECLQNYSWPGNIRELRNAMEGAVALEQDQLISLRSLPRSIVGFTPSEEPVQLAQAEGDDFPEEGVVLDDILSEVERRYMFAALRKANDSKTQAARLLGMSFRSFRYRLAKYRTDDAG